MALTVALLLPAAVAADTGGTGKFLNTDSETLCNADLLCTTASASAFIPEDDDQVVCLVLSHTDNEIGGFEYERETGCTSTFTLTISKGGFIVGFSAPTLHLDSSLGGAGRDVAVSGTYEITSAIDRSNTVEMFPDSPDPGCTTTLSARVRTVQISGTLTVDTTDFDDAGSSVAQVVNVRTRC
jgi:hypothetical protein